MIKERPAAPVQAEKSTSCPLDAALLCARHPSVRIRFSLMHQKSKSPTGAAAAPVGLFYVSSAIVAFLPGPQCPARSLLREHALFAVPARRRQSVQQKAGTMAQVVLPGNAQRFLEKGLP